MLPIPVHSTNTTKEYFLADKQRVYQAGEGRERGKRQTSGREGGRASVGGGRSIFHGLLQSGSAKKNCCIRTGAEPETKGGEG